MLKSVCLTLKCKNVEVCSKYCKLLSEVSSFGPFICLLVFFTVISPTTYTSDVATIEAENDDMVHDSSKVCSLL